MTDDQFETEMRVRYLRDLVFGTPISNSEWTVCKDNWMKPVEIQWLELQVEPKPVRVGRRL